MNFQTKLKFKKQTNNIIDYNSKVVLLGSCFSENIVEKFSYFKFQSVINPFGILFHALAIENLITRAIHTNYYSENDLTFHNEQWCCLDAHSILNSGSKELVLKRLNSEIENTNSQLKTASHIVITLGTSWVYKHIETDAIVANCHKLPQNQFLKTLLTVEEITRSLNTIVSLVRHVNPKISFIFTVSPVRHLKDGFVENTQSKAHLITAIHNLLNKEIVPVNDQLYYFPSYEIMMDELRDYRFYNQDMLHPNTLAIDYIWEKFKAVWISDSTEETLKMVDSIQKRKLHKPFNSKSEAHRQFLKTLEKDIDTLKIKHPQITF